MPSYATRMTDSRCSPCGWPLRLRMPAWRRSMPWRTTIDSPPSAMPDRGAPCAGRSRTDPRCRRRLRRLPAPRCARTSTSRSTCRPCSVSRHDLDGAAEITGVGPISADVGARTAGRPRRGPDDAAPGDRPGHRAPARPRPHRYEVARPARATSSPAAIRSAASRAGRRKASKCQADHAETWDDGGDTAPRTSAALRAASPTEDAWGMDDHVEPCRRLLRLDLTSRASVRAAARTGRHTVGARRYSAHPRAGDDACSTSFSPPGHRIPSPVLRRRSRCGGSG